MFAGFVVRMPGMQSTANAIPAEHPYDILGVPHDVRGDLNAMRERKFEAMYGTSKYRMLVNCRDARIEEELAWLTQYRELEKQRQKLYARRPWSDAEALHEWDEEVREIGYDMDALRADAKVPALEIDQYEAQTRARYQQAFTSVDNDHKRRKLSATVIMAQYYGAKPQLPVREPVQMSLRLRPPDVPPLAPPEPFFDDTQLLAHLRKGSRLDDVADDIRLNPDRAALIIEPLLRRVANTPVREELKLRGYDGVLDVVLLQKPEVLQADSVASFIINGRISHYMGDQKRADRLQRFANEMKREMPGSRAYIDNLVEQADQALPELFDMIRWRDRSSGDMMTSIKKIRADLSQIVGINLFEVEAGWKDRESPRRNASGYHHPNFMGTPPEIA